MQAMVRKYINIIYFLFVLFLILKWLKYIKNINLKFFFIRNTVPDSTYNIKLETGERWIYFLLLVLKHHAVLPN